MAKQGAILVVDDEAAILEVMQLNLVAKGYVVYLASSGPAGLRLLAEKVVDAVLVDFKMPGMNGLEFLQHVHRTHPDIPVIMVTAYGTIQMAVEAMRIGAFSYLTKPLNYEEMFLLVRQALEKQQLVCEVRELKQQVGQENRFANIITNNRKMMELLELVATIARTDATVLVRGETGTGKELLAKALHYASPRAARPLVTVNCTALSEGLLESELFGHVKGAFTGATRDHKGRFEAADGGSLFLDEIGDISPSMQAKLLRVLQEMEFERVGSNETIKVDVRIIASTNRPLEEAIKMGRFREDLFYRLNVIPVYVPPLRERKDDIVLLAQHFLEKFRQKHKKTGRIISSALMTGLLGYDWPGNVRELEHSIERAIILSQGEELEIEHFPTLGKATDDTVARPQGERERLLELEEKYAGVPNTLAMVAQEMGIDASTLYRKRKKYGLL